MHYRAFTMLAAALLFSACGKKSQQGDDQLSQEQQAIAGVDHALQHDANGHDHDAAMVGTAAPPHLVQDFMAGSMNQLGAKLLNQLAAEAPGENVNISPWSIANALTLLSDAARNETLDELYEVLSYPHVQHYDDYYARALKALNDDLITAAQLPRSYDADDSETAPGSALSFANGLWINRQVPLEIAPAFQRVVDDYFSAEVRNQPFAGNLAAIRQEINQWIAQNTNDRIQDMIADGVITNETAAVIVNAIAFKAAWANEFYEDATTPGDFHTAQGETIQTPKMRRTFERMNLVNDERFVAFDIPYAQHSYVMTVVLPNENQLDATRGFLFNDRGFETLGETMANAETKRVDLRLPRFRFDSTADVRSALEALGVHAPFRPNADFSGLFENAASGLAVTDILHQAYIDVNEKGTDAAAATVAVIALTSAPTSFVAEPQLVDVNRPFFYVIRDVRHSTPLFMGLVNNPAN